jgi:ABC-type dipeptide/oligopeptide/nickel transport system permease subunit
VEYARIARGEVLVVREREFTQAARLMGASNNRIIWRHILPNNTTPLLVTATLQVAQFIIAEASISFLGFGVQPPTPAWGSMINEGFANIFSSWWMITVPGVLLFLTVLALNLIGDALRDVLDPRTDQAMRMRDNWRRAAHHESHRQTADADGPVTLVDRVSLTRCRRRRATGSPARAAAARR